MKTLISTLFEFEENDSSYDVQRQVSYEGGTLSKGTFTRTVEECKKKCNDDSNCVGFSKLRPNKTNTDKKSTCTFLTSLGTKEHNTKFDTYILKSKGDGGVTVGANQIPAGVQKGEGWDNKVVLNSHESSGFRCSNSHTDSIQQLRDMKNMTLRVCPKTLATCVKNGSGYGRCKAS